MKITFTLILSIITTFLYAQSMKENTVADSSFVIKEHDQPVYEGISKDGKPFSGYFKKEYRELEMILVDYYENGQAKYQYSKAFLLEEEQIQYGKKTLNVRATYKDGKITDGPEYVMVDKGLTIKHWKAGKVESFTLDMFAMNYFNRLTFKKLTDKILITNFEDKQSEITLQFKNGLLISELSANGKPVFYIQQIENNAYPANSIINGIRRGKESYFNATRKIDLKVEPFHVYKINAKLLVSLDLSGKKSLDEVFNYLVSFFSQEEALLVVYKSGAAPKDESLVSTYLDIDGAGKVSKGITWTNAAKPYYEIYDKGKVIRKEEKSITEFQKIYEKYIEKMYAE